MADDAQLLRHYVETKSEKAFAELVQRHLNLVYFSAVRQLGSEKHLAEDVAQSVFLLLAGKSRELLHHPSLTGWLHATTHFMVARALRTERRRRLRDDAAHAMNKITTTSTEEEWERIRPVLDQVLLELNSADREAVLLRFFENRPFAEIGTRLLLTEKAAHKRVERALEKLRERLAKRGLKSTSAVLVTLLGTEAAMAAPAGLAATVTTSVVASGLPAAVAMGAFMSTKMTLTAVAAVVLATGVTTFQVRAQRDADAAVAAAERENDALAANVRAAEALLAKTKFEAVPPPQPVPAAPASSASRPAPLSMEARISEGREFLRANPEVKEALVTYHEATLRAQYADLFAAMGLNDEEIERFLTIQMNATTRIVGEHFLSVADEEMRPGEFSRQLRELLGEARYQQYRDFQAVAPARGLADELARSLYLTPQAMNPTQKEGFKQLVLQALSDPSVGPRYTGNVWPYIPAPVWEQIFSRAPGALAPEQVASLRDLYQQSQFFHAQTAALRKFNEAPKK